MSRTRPTTVRTRNRRAQRSGKVLEDYLERLHRLYERRGWAWVRKIDPPRTSSGSYRGKGPPDFLGHIRGIPVVFDAKRTHRTFWAFSLLSHHQAKDLDSALITGACAFLALDVQGKRYLVWWSDIRDAWWSWYQHTLKRRVAGAGRAGRGQASLNQRALSMYGHKFHPTLGWAPVVCPDVLELEDARAR